MVGKDPFLVGFENRMIEKTGASRYSWLATPAKKLQAVKRTQKINNIRKNKPLQKAKRYAGYGLVGGAGGAWGLSSMAQEAPSTPEQRVHHANYGVGSGRTY